MDSLTFPAGQSGLDPLAGEPAARPAPDGSGAPGPNPAHLLARSAPSAPPAAPVRPARGAVAPPPMPALAAAIESLITEDDEPVDNILSEKQQRLLTEPLYSSWAGPGAGRPFLAAANVGVFPEPRNPAIVPDVFLSLDVQAHPNFWEKAHRSYFLWEFGKPPDLVVEIVSNRKGSEIEGKRLSYARMGVGYYVVYDPLHEVMPDELRVYRLSGGRYERQESLRFPELGLGMTLWEGVFEDLDRKWLRWTDAHGALIPTGKEHAEQAHQRADQALRRADHERHLADQERRRADHERHLADQERRRADQERRHADQERRRAERLAALLRRSGIDPGQE